MLGSATVSSCFNVNSRPRRESMITKIKETDDVCACHSFLLILVPEREGAYFYGGQDMVSRFFSTGVSRNQFPRSTNVRPVSRNPCSVLGTSARSELVPR